jgi:hypothetical protein
LRHRPRDRVSLTARERYPGREEREAEHGQRDEQGSPVVTGTFAPARDIRDMADGDAPLTNLPRHDPRLAKLRHPRPGRGRRTGLRRADTDGSPGRLSQCGVPRSASSLPGGHRRRCPCPCRRRLRSSDRRGRNMTGHGRRLRAGGFGGARERRRRSHGGWRLHLGLGLRGRRLLRRAPGRQERQRVDIAVRIGGQADAQIHVRLGPLGLAARADRADDVALRDRGPDRDPDRAEVDEGDRVPVLGPDRQAEALHGKTAGEGDDPGRCGTDVGSGRCTDVDPAMLTAGVRIATADERS